MKNITRLIGFGYLAIAIAAVIANSLLGSIGYAPFPISVGPAPEPVVVTIWYGTEKKEWLDAAVKRFAETNPHQGRRPIQIKLVGIGSRELPLRVAAQDWRSDPQPTVISPASSIWVELLRSEWAARGNQGAIVDTGQSPPLALTPLVLVAWEERANVLWPKGQADFWQQFHTALTQSSWVDVARKNGFAEGSPELLKAQNWGPVKFGHTSPLTSNSGAQTLLLMAYGFFNKTSGLTVADVQNREFITWMAEIEQAVPQFGDSTGTFMDEMVLRGPSQYDVVAVYENLAIENIDKAKRWGNLKISYPPSTIFSDHPYAILNAPWVTADQQAAAGQFRDFLLSRPIQELALQYGFRPADPNVPITASDPNNPFNKYQSSGIRVDVGQQVASPAGDVLSALLAVWQQQVNR
jgi:ABC-type Fe3+ transport system substrate-binding protein